MKNLLILFSAVVLATSSFAGDHKSKMTKEEKFEQKAEINRKKEELFEMRTHLKTFRKKGFNDLSKEKRQERMEKCHEKREKIKLKQKKLQTKINPDKKVKSHKDDFTLRRLKKKKESGKLSSEKYNEIKQRMKAKEVHK